MWTRLLLLGMLVCVLPGCTTPGPAALLRQASISPELRRSAELYVGYGLDHGWDMPGLPGLVSVRLVDYIQGDKAGVCLRYPYLGTRYILVSRQGGAVSRRYIQEVLLHEMGHCVSNWPHSDDPASLMYGMETEETGRRLPAYLLEKAGEEFGGG